MRSSCLDPVRPVLVTGANGFLGRKVVEKLRKSGYSVVAFVLPGEAVPEAWEHDGVTIIRGDITSAEQVAKASEGVQLAIHMAAVVVDGGRYSLHKRVTVGGTENLFAAARQEGFRVLLVSSITVYGRNTHRQVCYEDTPFGEPQGPYSKSKQEQERIALRYHEQFQVPYTIIRPGNIFGPGSPLYLDELVNVILHKEVHLIEGGDHPAGLTYVDNVADLIVLAAESEKAINETFNACDDEPVTWRRYFEDIAVMVGRPPDELKSVNYSVAWASAVLCQWIWRVFDFKSRPALTCESLNMIGTANRIPIDKAKQLLGYTPPVSYSEALETVRGYLDSKDLLAAQSDTQAQQ